MLWEAQLPPVPLVESKQCLAAPLKEVERRWVSSKASFGTFFCWFWIALLADTVLLPLAWGCNGEDAVLC